MTTHIRYHVTEDGTPDKRAVLTSDVPAPTHPEDLPAWMDTAPLDAVMGQDADQIVAAIEDGATDLPSLLGALTKETR